MAWGYLILTNFWVEVTYIANGMIWRKHIYISISFLHKYILAGRKEEGRRRNKKENISEFPLLRQNLRTKWQNFFYSYTFTKVVQNCETIKQLSLMACSVRKV